MEERFESIAAEAVAEAEGVDCELVEFRDGLKTMIGVLRERLNQVDAELGLIDDI
jgi:hypothetical protein